MDPLIPTVLALNPGSSSVKAAVALDGDRLGILVERIGSAQGVIHVEEETTPFAGDLDAAVDAVGDALERRGIRPDAVSHRVVHGGPRHFEPAYVDEALLADLRAAVPLAPLHLPGALRTIARARSCWPAAAHVACFDTGFHRDLPEVSRRLPVAAEVAALGVRRYGFHGLSLQSVLGARSDLGEAVIAHLGSGCSVTAVDGHGRSLHTTMSMTPTAGMMSATRTGDIDPEVVLYLVAEHGLEPARLRDLFDRQSGLAGIAAGRHDVRDLLAAPDADAALALDMFVRSAAMAIASCATALSDWRSLVFTGGVGEHSDEIRARILARVRPPSEVAVLTVPADEERVLDELARELLSRR